MRHGGPGNDLAVAGIQDEEDAHDLAIASMDLQMVGVPAHALTIAAGAAQK